MTAPSQLAGQRPRGMAARDVPKRLEQPRWAP